MVRERVYTLPFIWGKTVWAFTLIFFAGSVIYIGMLVYLIFNGTTVAAVAGLVVALPVLVGIMIFCEGYSPQRLEISQSKITVLRRYDSITIPRSMVVSIVQLEPKDMKRVYTDGGCAGLFGYFGGFRSKQLGRFKMYATSMNNLYLITLSDSKKFVIQCEEPKLLL